MQIIVNDPNLKCADLKGFCVGWEQPLEPETLFASLKGSYRYVIARDDNGKVIGFANAISDGVFAAYIPLVEVLPEDQGARVGTAIMRELLHQLQDLRIVDLMCDPPLQAFYKTLDMIPMVGMRAREKGEDSHVFRTPSRQRSTNSATLPYRCARSGLVALVAISKRPFSACHFSCRRSVSSPSA